MGNTVFGVIVTNRSFFPDYLVAEGRKEILKKLKAMGYDVVTLSEEDTPLGAVQTFSDAEKCAKLFRENAGRIDGIIVSLPNFGEELSVASAIDMSGLDVPVLIHAADDDEDRMQIENRRDAFCGKLSLCNNLYQRNIKFTSTRLHTCPVDSEQFTEDIKFFEAVCRVVKGISSARIGAAGTRPDPFNTVRYSEKLLQASGISVTVVDLMEIIEKAKNMPVTEKVHEKVSEIEAYGNIPGDINKEKVLKQAKFCLALEDWVKSNKCDAIAVQCWDSIQKYYGCATCLGMSMLCEKGMPGACEMDVTGALSMYALYLASGRPPAYLDWNNNFTEDRNVCVCQHCSNFPKSFFQNPVEIENLDVLGTTLGADNCFGACKGKVAGGPMTYMKITTDDKNGKIKLYLGEGEFLDKPVDTKGGVAVCRVPDLQGLLKYISRNGFEHHVAMSRSRVADVLEEALGNYIGWDIYRHK